MDRENSCAGVTGSKELDITEQLNWTEVSWNLPHEFSDYIIDLLALSVSFLVDSVKDKKKYFKVLIVFVKICARLFRMYRKNIEV